MFGGCPVPLVVLRRLTCDPVVRQLNCDIRARIAADVGIAIPGRPVYSCSRMHPGHGSTGTCVPSRACWPGEP